MKKTKKRDFFWTYATASIFLFIIVMGLHSLWQIKRGKKALYKVLYDQGEALVESLQSSGKNAIISNKLAQDILINRLLDNAGLIDMLIEQTGYNSNLLKEIVAKNKLFCVQVLDRLGRVMLDSKAPSSPDILNWLPQHQEAIRMGIAPILRGEKNVMVEGIGREQPVLENLFWVAMARKNFQGAIIIHVDAYYMDRFRKEIGIRKLISDLAEQKGIRYISFQDRDNNFVAPEDISPSKLENIHHHPDFVRAGFHHLSSGEEVYEIIKPFLFKDRVLGLFRVGLSLDKFMLNIRQTQKHAIWFSLLVITLGSGGLILIFYHQYIQYKRQKIQEKILQRTERLNSIGKLAAGVAHEIRNPLNAIGMTIQRLQHEYLPESKENKHEFIHFTTIIREEVKRVDKIIGNFLNFAREPKRELQQVDLSSILDNMLLIFAAEAEKQKVKIYTEYTHSPLHCWCDKNQIKQALINIIRNAIQAMPDGGEIFVKVSQRRDNILISVKDTGVGIADTAKIFEIYYTSKEGGVGVGLPICQKIIEDHGGKIEVNSKVGEGTEFLILLPNKPVKSSVKSNHVNRKGEFGARSQKISS